MQCTAFVQQAPLQAPIRHTCVISVQTAITAETASGNVCVSSPSFMLAIQPEVPGKALFMHRRKRGYVQAEGKRVCMHGENGLTSKLDGDA